MSLELGAQGKVAGKEFKGKKRKKHKLFQLPKMPYNNNYDVSL